MVAVLFSSGIDSWACLNWAIQRYGSHNVLPLYINFGQCYAEKEIEHAQRLCNLLFIKLHVFDVKSGLFIEDPVTKHVPFRNTFFLEIAAMLDSVDEIVFGMIQGDWSEDKNPKYVRMMQELINSQLVATIHRPLGKIKISTPFAKKTKTEVVKWLLDNSYVGKQGVLETIGCYSSEEVSCGGCISCFSRWVALHLNGIKSEKQDCTYVMWMIEQLEHPNHTQSKLAMLKLFWRKRAFIMDVHKALNDHCHEKFDRSFLRMYLFN